MTFSFFEKKKDLVIMQDQLQKEVEQLFQQLHNKKDDLAQLIFDLHKIAEKAGINLQSKMEQLTEKEKQQVHAKQIELNKKIEETIVISSNSPTSSKGRSGKTRGLRKKWIPS